jgi:adenylate cyclase
MDVTLVATGRSATMDIPEEGIDRRIRTSLSTVCGMGYGIADSMGDNDHSTMLDLVHEFPGRKGEAIFAMFGQTHAPQQKSDVTPNKLSKFLHDRFVRVFMTQLAAIDVKLRSEGTTSPQHWRNGVLKALHWTFLKLNQDLFFTINSMQRKNSQTSTGSSPIFDSQYARIGVSGIAIYFLNKTLFAANAGDALAVVSRQGVCVEVSRKHDPCDREETARIRSAEGFISTEGLVNDEVAVSRSFGYFKFFPTLNAKPDLFAYELTDLDEFVIIANRGLWDFVPYQTAVDIARTVAKSERPDPMVAAQKLRDFAISYGSNGSTMIMVIWVADLFDTAARSRQPTLESLVDPQMYRTRKKDEVRDRVINRLVDEVPPPIGHLTLVFTDIRNSTHLWETNAGMRSAMRLHNHLLRRQLRFCGGYEVKTEGDAFMCSFPTSLAAVWFCFTVQLQLLHEPWPLEILQSEDGKPILDEEGHLIARGLSVRMGIHCGSPLCETDVITHRMDYFGPMVNKSSRISGCAQGGQIMVSNDIIREINASVFNTEEATEYSSHQNPYAIDAIREMGVVVKTIGEVKLKGIELPEILSVIYPSGLENRHELDENPDPEPEPLLPDATVGQLGHLAKDLGMVCLSLEALSNMRIFRPLPARKDSGQPSDRCDSFKSVSVFYADPNLLLPAVSDNLSDEEFLVIFESFVTRVENAVDATVNAFNAKFAVAPTCSGEDLIEALRRDNALDENTLKYISSVLDSFIP